MMLVADALAAVLTRLLLLMLASGRQSRHLAAGTDSTCRAPALIAIRISVVLH